MSDLLNLLKLAPKAAKLATIAQRAAQGDPEAVAYIRQEGWKEALDMYRPGASAVVSEGVDQVREVVGNVRDTMRGGTVIEGQYRVLDDDEVDTGDVANDSDRAAARLPWGGFVRWLAARRWGTFVILGPKGQGKTTLALRLAQRWQERLGWPVLAVNIHPEDRLSFMTPVPSWMFMQTIKRLMAWLNPPDPGGMNRRKLIEMAALLDEDRFADLAEQHDLDDMKLGELQRVLRPIFEPLPSEVLAAKIAPYRRQIILLDEMSLLVNSNAADEGRAMVRGIMAQARHLEWLMIYIGQQTRMLPLDLLRAEATFVKRPDPDDVLTDRQEPLTIHLWQQAIQGFEEIRRSPWWREASDPRQWAYVKCSDIGGGRSYYGMVPVAPPTVEDAD